MFVDPRWIYRLGLSINQACVWGYVGFRCNGKPEAWFSILEAALALGLCRRTIELCLAVLAAWALVDIRPGRKSGGRTNRYKLAPFGWLTSWKNYQHVPAQKCHLLRNTLPTVGLSYARFARNDSTRTGFGLSEACRLDQEPYGKLIRFRVHPKVARQAAVDWQDYPKSVDNAFINAAYLAEADAETLRRHNLAPLRGDPVAYALGTLKRAYSEGHRVKLNKLAEEGEARRKGGARAAAGGRPSEAELKRIEKHAELVLKPCLAEPHTPGKSAIPVQKPQFCDKSAEDKGLRAVLAAARRNSYSYLKYAKPGQKLGFSVDPCSGPGISV